MKAKTKGLESVNTFIFIHFSPWATHVEGICSSVKLLPCEALLSGTQCVYLTEKETEVQNRGVIQ